MIVNTKVESIFVKQTVKLRTTNTDSIVGARSPILLLYVRNFSNIINVSHVFTMRNERRLYDSAVLS